MMLNRKRFAVLGAGVASAAVIASPAGAATTGWTAAHLTTAVQAVQRSVSADRKVEASQWRHVKALDKRAVLQGRTNIAQNGQIRTLSVYSAEQGSRLSAIEAAQAVQASLNGGIIASVVAIDRRPGIPNGGWTITLQSGDKIDVYNGADGAKGDKGEPGSKGDQGDPGAPGAQGPKGEQGQQGAPGQTGAPGDNGAPGLSAYQLWLAAGNSGTVGDFMQSLKGERGQTGVQGAPGQDGVNGRDGAPGQDGVNGRDGAPGQDGVNGRDGAPGQSAYQQWLELGNAGTMGDFMKSLVGPQGAKGDPGAPGASGAKGDKGDRGEAGPEGPQGVAGIPNAQKVTICVIKRGASYHLGFANDCTGAGSDALQVYIPAS